MRTRRQLNDKYTLEAGQVYLTGVQALVRLPLDQMRRDRRAGLNTGCFISGYEGSPLGGYDLALGRIAGLLAEHNIVFRPGVNEDLAATAVSGSQLLETLPRPTVDGVVGVWYGKGPGVDRSGDAFRHANLAGTGRNSGALALAGDDHVSKSSTIPHQSELALYSAGMPTLAAATTQDVLDLGFYGIALSRYCGAWAALKLATDICDGGGTIEVSPERCPVVEPWFEIDGRPWRKSIHPLLIAPGSLEAERDLYEYRLEAARRFAHANGLNRIETRHPGDRFGIIACGKAYADLQTALRNMALDEEALAQAGVRILRLGMTYPLEPRIIAELVEGLETVLVVEEKRSFVELQLRELLFNQPRRPLVYGKQGPDGETLLPAYGELDAEVISRALGRFLIDAPGVRQRLERLDEIDARYGSALLHAPIARTATYCSGLSAQPLDDCAGGPDRRRRHRLPRHGGAWPTPGAGSLGWGTWARRAATGLARRRSRDAAPVPEHRRRHLLPTRPPGRAGGGAGRRQHHLQDLAQRRRRDDRRAGCRRRGLDSGDDASWKRAASRESWCSATSRRSTTARPGWPRTWRCATGTRWSEACASSSGSPAPRR